jgi:hypothetical protein
MDTLVAAVGVCGLVLTVLLVRAAARGRPGAPPERTRARWAVATLTGLLTVGAAGIALMRAVA